MKFIVSSTALLKQLQLLQGVLASSKPPLPLVNPRGCWEQLRGAG